MRFRLSLNSKGFVSQLLSLAQHLSVGGDAGMMELIQQIFEIKTLKILYAQELSNFVLKAVVSLPPPMLSCYMFC